MRLCGSSPRSDRILAASQNARRSQPMSIAPITDRRIHVQPGDVHNVLSRHMLADGYEIVMDLRKSQGSWVFDARRGRNVLDFFTNFASCPIGYNHPRLDNPEFREKLAEVRSEEHTSELQSLTNLVCRLLLEKKNDNAGIACNKHATQP